MIHLGKSRARRLLRRGGMLLPALMAAILLQGCWDEVDLQDVSYVSAIGIDYKEEQFTIYAQMIKFAQVAKSESPQPDPNPVWIGKGKGDTVMLAFNNLARAGQANINIEHLKTIVVHERALSKINDIIDGLNRQRASRYTTWVFGSRVPIEDVLTTDTFFDQSPLNSILYIPVLHENQHSFIRPHEMQLAVQSLKEPSKTTTLPVLDVSDASWQRGKKPLQTQLITGIFVFRELKYVGYLPEASVEGLRWMNPEFELYMLGAEGANGKATMAVRSTRGELKAKFKKGQPEFVWRLKLQGEVAEIDGTIKNDEIIASIESQVKRQIEETYKKGLANKMDLFDLSHHLYRYHHAQWKLTASKEDWLPRADQLKVEVKFQLTHSGKFELNNDT